MNKDINIYKNKKRAKKIKRLFKSILKDKKIIKEFNLFKRRDKNE